MGSSWLGSDLDRQPRHNVKDDNDDLVEAEKGVENFADVVFGKAEKSPMHLTDPGPKSDDQEDTEGQQS